MFPAPFSFVLSVVRRISKTREISKIVFLSVLIEIIAIAAVFRSFTHLSWLSFCLYPLAPVYLCPSLPPFPSSFHTAKQHQSGILPPFLILRSVGFFSLRALFPELPSEPLVDFNHMPTAKPTNMKMPKTTRIATNIITVSSRDRYSSFL